MNIKDTLEASCYKLVYPQIDKFNVQLFNFIDVNSLGSLTFNLTILLIAIETSNVVMLTSQKRGSFCG